ncbi:hypothetical protein ACIOD2_44915 [Amycolatopsis sp. NPDC088138]|uniref:hypothetical protein n=1 Tax=Amycolatopsis sp. NPDC088138 TaxID=3363938 RepID=UPI00381EC79C
MPDITDEEAENFFARLDEFKKDLTDPQRDLLKAVLWLAWTATEEEGRLTDDFEGSFAPSQALAMVRYHTGAISPVEMIPRICKGFIRSHIH